MGKDKPSYYAVIPSSVRYDNRLKANSKLLYGEITALCNKEGFCWAGNRYFSELYGVSEKSITRWINDLVDAGHIRSEVTKNGEGTSRTITLCPLDKNVLGGETELSNGSDKNVPHNNTPNTTSNNIEERSQKFKLEVIEFFQSKEYSMGDAEDFFNYWSEKNRSKTKMLFETKATWELSKRVATWIRRKKDSGQKKKVEPTGTKVDNEALDKLEDQYG